MAGSTVTELRAPLQQKLRGMGTEVVSGGHVGKSELLDESTRAHLRGRRQRLPLEREPVVDRGPLGGDSSPQGLIQGSGERVRFAGCQKHLDSAVSAAGCHECLQ